MPWFLGRWCIPVEPSEKKPRRELKAAFSVSALLLSVASRHFLRHSWFSDVTAVDATTR